MFGTNPTLDPGRGSIDRLLECNARVQLAGLYFSQIVPFVGFHRSEKIDASQFVCAIGTDRSHIADSKDMHRDLLAANR